jgi:hypothetical protein
MMIMPQLQVNPTLSSLVSCHLQDIGFTVWRTAYWGVACHDLAMCQIFSLQYYIVRLSSLLLCGLCIFRSVVDKDSIPLGHYLVLILKYLTTFH